MDFADDARDRDDAPWPGKRTLVQMMYGPGYRASIDRAHEAAARGIDSPGSALPHADRIQESFGPRHDVSGIRAHVGGAAADACRDLGAIAFASGTDVAFRSAPDLHTAAHEAAHVVQQAQGVNLYGGVGEAGDAYERHADAVAERVVAGRSAEDLLGAPSCARAARTSAVQLAEDPAAAGACEETPVADPGSDEKFAPAASFEALIELVAVAEARLAAAGMASSTQDVVHILRGIYYGTEWSMDYEGAGGEGSEMRNRGFDYYTKTSRPEDPRAALGESLFHALRESYEISDPGGRVTDFGHLIIGLDANNWAARNLPTGSGGTGLDVVTWLGDIGGGAGMLAMRRGGAMGTADPSKDAADMFLTGHDYGASINVEGDIAGTVGVVVADGQTLSEALRDYLIGCGDGASRYNQRAALFLEYLGGEVAGGALANEADLIDKLAGQIQTFGTIYALTRLQDQGKGTPSTIRESGRHIEGASREMATILVKMLVASMANPSAKIAASRKMDPGATQAAADPTWQFEAAALALEVGKEAEKRAGEIGL